MDPNKQFDIEMQLKKLAFDLSLPKVVVKEGIKLSKEYIIEYPMVRVNTLVSAIIFILSKKYAYHISQNLICKKNNVSLSSVKQIVGRLQDIIKSKDFSE